MKRTLFFFYWILIAVGCKDKNSAIPELPYGLPGTYEGTSAEPSVIFRDVLSEYDSFKETVTVTITQTGPNVFQMQLELKGLAKKGASTSGVYYGFRADLTGGQNANFSNQNYNFKGKFSNMTPLSADLEKRAKDVVGYFEGFSNKLEGGLLTHYKLDLTPIVLTKMTKIRQ